MWYWPSGKKMDKLIHILKLLIAKFNWHWDKGYYVRPLRSRQGMKSEFLNTLQETPQLYVSNYRKQYVQVTVHCDKFL